jgi:hypothetical protein
MLCRLSIVLVRKLEENQTKVYGNSQLGHSRGALLQLCSGAGIVYCAVYCHLLIVHSDFVPAGRLPVPSVQKFDGVKKIGGGRI